MNKASQAPLVASNVPEALIQAIIRYSDNVAMSDDTLKLTYRELGRFVIAAETALPADQSVAIYGSPGALMAATCTACVILGLPFVHLDPAMPTTVIENILAELNIGLVLTAQTPKADQLPDCVTVIDANTLRDGPAGVLKAAEVNPTDIIYLVATSGTTGRPKCIPVTHDAAHLSYVWRDAYTPYTEEMRVGIYIFAIWEMFRPLRNGAQLCFPSANTLMTPTALAAFLTENQIAEMLFTPSFYENTLVALPPDIARQIPLTRVVLNGEVVTDELITLSTDLLPNAALWNLYSICETHDVSMTHLVAPQGAQDAVPVGKAMEHLTTLVLDDNDQPCPPNTHGLLHFAGPRMLGPGYINRPEETALRFRTLTINGQNMRLYDTGDGAYVDTDGNIFVLGRVAHMLKLRGHSIQTRELVDTLHGLMDFAQGIPWVQQIGDRGQALIFYFTTARDHENRWGLKAGTQRVPAALAQELRSLLPAYCIPSYFVRLNEIPINEVSGKCDYKRLPQITLSDEKNGDETDVIPTLTFAAEVMGCAAGTLDPAQSFHDQGGDSLMAVNLLLALEAAYQRRVDFDLALNVPLGRLHDLLIGEVVKPDTHGIFTRPGILLTGATGFLGQKVLAAAAANLSDDHVVYCLVRPKTRDAQDRLGETANGLGVSPDRFVLIPAAMEDAFFGLSGPDYKSLCKMVTSVIHCAAMVNLAVDRKNMETWSQVGISNILQFCRDAGADLRFSSSNAVFPETGGPYPEAPTELFDGCNGYGAAKIAAEAQIARSDVPAAIVRLPSLYDMDAPNPKDIYEVIMSACRELGAVPKGLTFAMTDVRAAAAFLAQLPPVKETAYYNLVPDDFITNTVGMTELPWDDWIAKAPLTDVEKALFRDTSVFRANAVLSNEHAKEAWSRISPDPLLAQDQLLAQRLPQ